MDEISELSKQRATQLEAWPAILGALFDAASSDAIISVIDGAGLVVDWTVTEKESFSHNTRKRAYRPRVQAAFVKLDFEDQKAVLAVISGQLAFRFPAYIQDLTKRLRHIGWTLKTTDKQNLEITSQPTDMKRDKELQRLLLLQLRDNQDPVELEKYSEGEKLHNASLLVKGGYVEGHVIQNGSGIDAAVVMTQLTSKGHDFLDENTAITPSVSTNTSAIPAANPANGTQLIFVSHSSADQDLAGALVDLLCSALHLRRSDLLCTSVDGAKLPGGADTDEVLRSRIITAPAFLSVLTPAAVKRTYVLFELGARWGSGYSHIPLLGKGAGAEVLKEPLKATNALRLGRESDVLQLVHDVGIVLQRQAEPVHGYLNEARKIVVLSKAGALAQARAVAKKRLNECIEIVRSTTNIHAAIGEMRGLQRAWNQRKEQVSVILDGRMELHVDSNLEKRSAEGSWQQDNGISLYKEMTAEQRGIKTVELAGWPNRKTVIAFDYSADCKCMIVIEVHLHDENCPG